MAEINISSKNQSGGITAHTVDSASTPPPRKRGVFAWVIGIATIVGAIAAVLALF